MVISDEADRIIAKCAHCGKIYTSQLWPDGKITPVGQPPGCECGETDFVNLNEEVAGGGLDMEEITEEK